ncbi:MAG: damage-control phosphatase, subfamily [Clostridiales bacterium]|jgi:hypothetical protein|nr:damage-control phosphatase, subfamily [Clostridiales bacterium]
MKIARECIACLARQAVEIAEEATDCIEDQEKIIHVGLKALGELCFDETPPEVAYRMHQAAKAISGVEDPYDRLKEEYNRVAQSICDTIEEEKWLERSENAFDLACRLAIAGNIIDFSVGLELSPEAILRSVEDSLKQPLYGINPSVLKEAAEKAERILYIADNAGEIIFDKFLLRELPMEKVTYVVKGGPIVNDATMEDAISSGVSALVHVIDNGHNAQGTVLKACSEAFLQAFHSADLIISKGQANYETLSDIRDKDIFYLLRAKCRSIAGVIGCQRMDFVITR